jgi:hypothetical protein
LANQDFAAKVIGVVLVCAFLVVRRTLLQMREAALRVWKKERPSYKKPKIPAGVY